MKMYCLTCKKMQEAINAEKKTSEKGRRYAQGKCPVCGRKILGALKKEDW